MPVVGVHRHTPAGSSSPAARCATQAEREALRVVGPLGPGLVLVRPAVAPVQVRGVEHVGRHVAERQLAAAAASRAPHRTPGDLAHRALVQHGVGDRQQARQQQPHVGAGARALPAPGNATTSARPPVLTSGNTSRPRRAAAAPARRRNRRPHQPSFASMSRVTRVMPLIAAVEAARVLCNIFPITIRPEPTQCGRRRRAVSRAAADLRVRQQLQLTVLCECTRTLENSTEQEHTTRDGLPPGPAPPIAMPADRPGCARTWPAATRPVGPDRPAPVVPGRAAAPSR